MRKAVLAGMYAGSALLAGALGGPAAAAPLAPRDAAAPSPSVVTRVDGYRYHYHRCCRHRPLAYGYYAPRAYLPGPAYYAPPAPPVVYYPPPVLVYPPPVVVSGYAPPPAYAYDVAPPPAYVGYHGYFGGW
jgi:hypothetical protein